MTQSTETHRKPLPLLLSLLLAALLVMQMGVASYAVETKADMLAEPEAEVQAEPEAQSQPVPQAQEDHCQYKIDLSVQEYDQPGLEELAFSGMPTQRYFLLLDSSMLVCADQPEVLSELVMDVARGYVNENTVTCELANPKQVHLCYGQVFMLAPADLDQAAETLDSQLSFVTVDQVTEEKGIPFKQEKVEDPERYEDLPAMIAEGADGLKQVVTETTYLNGQLMDEKSTENVVSEPVNEVTTVGTKVRPEYIWPADGRISSGFGVRHIKVGSRNHKGLDIAVPTGTDIVASKAGVVSFAGYNGGYGYLVKIDHEDGTETYYGHNSELLVSKGDRVEQGDLIAYAGSTGRSTGPHCHFEIRIDGDPVNPRDYLPEK